MALKAFRLSPGNCSIYFDDDRAGREAAKRTENAFAARYYSPTLRWTGKDEAGKDIDNSFSSDPRYYYTRPLTRLSGSGHGSDLGNATSTSLRFLVDVIRELRIETLIDAPCGDVNWQFGAWEVDSLRAYVGLDIVHRLVGLNQQRYAFHSNKVFQWWDVSRCPLPQIQWLSVAGGAGEAGWEARHESPTLVHMRDMLQHLRISSGVRALQHVMRSGAEYLISTTFPAASADDVAAAAAAGHAKGAGRADASRPRQHIGGHAHGDGAGGRHRAMAMAATAEVAGAGGRRLASHGMGANRKIVDANFFRIDLSRPPFRLPPPIRCVPTHPQIEADLTCLYHLDRATREAWLRSMA